LSSFLIPSCEVLQMCQLLSGHAARLCTSSEGCDTRAWNTF
jgi:hypothetical protein